MAVADTFDAMSSNRVYRDGIETRKIVDELKFNKGKQFDPDIVDVFLGIIDSGELEEHSALRVGLTDYFSKNKEKKWVKS